LSVGEKLTLDRDDQLRDHWENLGTAVLQHVFNPLACEKVVWVCRLAQPVEEERKVVVEIEFIDLNLPRDLVSLCVVLQSDREVALQSPMDR
jgi:hypothetical protein